MIRLALVFPLAMATMIHGAAAQEAAAPPAPSTNAPAARSYLTKVEVEQTLGGKVHVFKHATSGSLLRWDLRSGGQMYYNNLTASNSGGNGSGTWEVNDKGGLCVKWNRVESGNGGCSYFFRDGDKLERTGSANPNATVNAHVEKIE